MISVLFLAVAAVCFVAAAARVLRGSPSPSRRGLVGMLTALGVAFTALSPAAQQLENLLWPHVGRLLSNTATLVAAYSTVVLLLHLRHPPRAANTRARGWLAGLVLAVGVMAAMFTAAPLPAPGLAHPSGVWDRLYDSEPGLVAYALVYAVYLGAALVELSRRSWTYAAQATRPGLRWGLRVVALGCGLGLAYVAGKIVTALSRGLDLGLWPAGYPGCTSPFTPVGCALDVGLPAVSVAVIALGSTLTAWGPWVALPLRLVRTWWGHRRLYPLWAALRDAVPEELETSPGALAERVPAGVTYRAYLRVVSIRDGEWALRNLRDVRVADAADELARQEGLSPAARRAAVEAAVVAAAVSARQAGRDPDAAPVDAPQPLLAPDDADLVAEIRWLERVADAFTRSPLVGRAAQAATRKVGTS